MTPISLGVLLRTGRDLGHWLGGDKVPRLRKISGGFAVSAPGVLLGLINDRIIVGRWDRSEIELQAALQRIATIVGRTFPLGDRRRVLAAVASPSPSPSPSPRAEPASVVRPHDPPESVVNPAVEAPCGEPGAESAVPLSDVGDFGMEM